MVFGREAKDCDFVIANQAVSRVHAPDLAGRGPALHRRLEKPQQDVRQQPTRRNADGPQRQRSHQDLRLLSDVSCRFAVRKQDPIPRTSAGRRRRGRARGRWSIDRAGDAQPAPATSTARSSTSRSAAGLLEISNSLAQTLELDQLLEKIAEVLLTTFRQADRCFIILSRRRGASDSAA